MCNPIVYTCTGRIHHDHRPAIQNVPLTKWMEEERVSPKRHAEAKRRLRELYTIKAAAVGMSLSAYCTRFNVKL